MCLGAMHRKPQLPKAVLNYISELGLETICFHYLAFKVGSGRGCRMNFKRQHKLFLAGTLVTYHLTEFHLLVSNRKSEHTFDLR